MTEAVESKAHGVCQQPHFPFGRESHHKEKEASGLREGGDEGGDGDGVLMTSKPHCLKNQFGLCPLHLRVPPGHHSPSPHP